MAMLASRGPNPTSAGMTNGSAPQYVGAATRNRTPVVASSNQGNFASPTESEFSEAYDGPDSVKAWDEKKVSDWLNSIGCTQYEPLFKANHFTGSNLIECDQTVLKEMGIKKIGDRVRIFVGIKALRNKAIGNHKKRNRDSISALDSQQGHQVLTPTSSGSPRRPTAARERTNTAATAGKRVSRYFEPSSLDNFQIPTSDPRPTSPVAESEGRGHRVQRFPGMSPVTGSRKGDSPNYFNNVPDSAKTAVASAWRPTTPVEVPPLTKSSTSVRHNQILDTTVGRLPAGQHVIRVIYNSGQTKVLDIKGCRTAEEITIMVLKRLHMPSQNPKNYCFYILDGLDQDPSKCYRLNDTQLMGICADLTRVERGRLILRKIHAGEPDEEDLRKAAGVAHEEHFETHINAVAHNNTRSQSKVQKLTGEAWETMKHPLPLAPTIQPLSERQLNINAATQDLERPLDQQESYLQRPPKPRIREFLGGRPPSELISQELTTYFPEHKREEIEKAVRMSMRRSARLSRAASRLSVASNVSFASSLKDAPPLPSIADSWFMGGSSTARGTAGGPRPLSVSRFALPNAAYRDSVASSALQPLQEESPIEPNRKSYVSFESGSDSAAMNQNDSEGNDRQSYFDEDGSSGPTTEAGNSLEQYAQVIAEDGEERDEELDQFLKGDSWEKVQWMQGALIGQGSFGSVFLALHAITAELMAVKQVEVPSNSNSEIDKKKTQMVAALKREINLLRDLQHPNIVQYLGSNSDDEHFNIFLEYVPGGSVAAMLNSYGQLHEALIRNFVRQILTGLEYLHGRGIIHRDIKGANVLVDNKGNIKISDFGISKRVEASALLQPSAQGGHIHRPSLQGSVFWMAPEVVRQTSYTRKADIWSLGCLIVEMFTGTHPFPNFSQLQAIFQIGNSSAKPTVPDNVSEEGKIFLKQTFEIDHEKRPSASELLLDPFLKQIA